MHAEPRAVFLLLRSLADLERTSRELSGYLSTLRRHCPARSPDAILGIWVEEEGVANLPAALTLPGEDGEYRSVRIPETTGLNGIWMLCWLDAPARTVSRTDLLAALLGRFGHDADQDSDDDARFIPVYVADMPSRQADDDARTLQLRYPGRVLAPVILDGDGTVHLAPVDSSGETAS